MSEETGVDETKESAGKLIASRMSACAFGMALGDALGKAYEFKPVRKTAEVYNEIKKKKMPDMGPWNRNISPPTRPGDWTDDAAMGLCLFEALELRSRSRSEQWMNLSMDLFYEWWHGGRNNGRQAGDPSIGLGSTIKHSIERWKIAKKNTSVREENPYFAAQQAKDALKEEKYHDGNGTIMRNAATGDLRKVP